MKKNVMMRIAACLLVCVLASTCGISGTFAKYVTDGKGTDTARVAKFGVQVQAFDGMFSETYVTEDANYVATITDSVVSGEKVVAPGTEGTMTDLVITGQPEVAVKVTYEATNIYLANWIDNEGNFYCPLFITINTVTLCGLDYASAEDFATAIYDNVASFTEAYAPGTILGNEQEHNMDISWRWAFEGAAGMVNTQTDVKDTYLGNWILRGEAHKPVITLEVTCTVTQIN